MCYFTPRQQSVSWCAMCLFVGHMMLFSWFVSCLILSCSCLNCRAGSLCQVPRDMKISTTLVLLLTTPLMLPRKPSLHWNCKWRKSARQKWAKSLQQVYTFIVVFLCRMAVFKLLLCMWNINVIPCVSHHSEGSLHHTGSGDKDKERFISEGRTKVKRGFHEV